MKREKYFYERQCAMKQAEVARIMNEVEASRVRIFSKETLLKREEKRRLQLTDDEKELAKMIDSVAAFASKGKYDVIDLVSDSDSD